MYVHKYKLKVCMGIHFTFIHSCIIHSLLLVFIATVAINGWMLLCLSIVRTVAATNMNEVSSRSHAVFTIVLTEKR